MKGTFAILGILFAAYAAPLFGNEVPLILDETIQMPVASSVWDVAPTWSGGYMWACGLQISDTISTVVWPTASQAQGDSLPNAIGTAKFVKLFVQVDGVWAIIRGSYRANPGWIDGSGPPQHYYVQVYSAAEAFSPIVSVTWSSYSEMVGGPHFYSIAHDEYVIAEVLPQSPPPDVCQRLVVWQKNIERSSDNGNIWQNGTRYSNFLDPNTYSRESLPVQNAFETRWVANSFEVGSGITGHESNPWPGQRRTTVFDTDEVIPVVVDQDWGRLAYGVTTYGSSRRPVILSSPYPVDSIQGWTLESGVLWSAPYFGDLKLVAYVLLSESTEQFLLLNSETHQFDIVLAETGQIWGQTAPLDSGYVEMKIIGRYHNETRRLVVRYGSELRIYRFGDPIYTDADDTRPELPNELTLAAYPNPFNPTTMIAFDLPKAGIATLAVFDLNGRLVKTLVNEQMSAGHHELGFDGASLPSGIYFARLSAGELVQTQKLVLLK